MSFGFQHYCSAISLILSKLYFYLFYAFLSKNSLENMKNMHGLMWAYMKNMYIRKQSENSLISLTLNCFSFGDLLQAFSHVSRSQRHGSWDVDQREGAGGRILSWNTKSERQALVTIISHVTLVSCEVRCWSSYRLCPQQRSQRNQTSQAESVQRAKTWAAPGPDSQWIVLWDWENTGKRVTQKEITYKNKVNVALRIFDNAEMSDASKKKVLL